jgi:pyruvate-formate lyase-activating enzyme
MSVRTTPKAEHSMSADPVEGVLFRSEPFGAFAYVPQRDHFYALDRTYSAVVDRIRRGTPVRTHDADRVRLLAELGICTTSPVTPQRAFFGRSLVGEIETVPWPSQPLVVNCFATAHCPLRCRYCHADDLMVGYRNGEDERWLRRVIATARATPAMVAVVTGGEPLTQPARAAELIGAVAGDKAVVLDTSGVGDLAALAPILHRHRVHVRVSLDSADPAVHDALRPINRRYLPPGTSSHAHARNTIRAAVAEGIACSVQTVVSARTQAPEQLEALRDLVVDLGATTWVLHVMVPVGKGARPAGARLLPDPAAEETLNSLVKRTADAQIPLDIRVTGTQRAPNAVLLINARGELCVENPASSSKTIVRISRPLPRRRILAAFREHADLAEHAARYLNGTLAPFPQQVGQELPYSGVTPARSSSASRRAERAWRRLRSTLRGSAGQAATAGSPPRPPHATTPGRDGPG